MRQQNQWQRSNELQLSPGLILFNLPSSNKSGFQLDGNDEGSNIYFTVCCHRQQIFTSGVGKIFVLIRQSTYKCINNQDDTISADPGFSANRAIEVASETELRYTPVLNFGVALNLQRPVG